MGRIRSIKPEAPQSENLGSVSRDARLLFFMLFTIADDEGRARAASRMLASVLFPYDDDAKTHIVEWLFELERADCIILYEVDGTAYLQIKKWLEHQRIDRPTESKLPAPPAKPRESSSNAREPSKTDRKGEDRKGSISSENLIENDFQTFYETYPRRESRGAALKAYRQAIKKTDPPTLLAAAQRFRAKRAGQDPKFTPLPATWLNAEKWLDDPVGVPVAVIVPSVHPTHPDGWRDRLRRWSIRGSWPPNWGPKPHEDGCLCPNEILAEFEKENAA